MELVLVHFPPEETMLCEFAEAVDGVKLRLLAHPEWIEVDMMTKQ